MKNMHININNTVKLVDYHFVRTPDITAYLSVEIDGEVKEIKATGNGRLDAISNALKKALNIDFSDLTYEEHALSTGSTSQAVTYLSLTLSNGKKSWGAGVHDDIIASSINALFSAINRGISK